MESKKEGILSEDDKKQLRLRKRRIRKIAQLFKHHDSSSPTKRRVLIEDHISKHGFHDWLQVEDVEAEISRSKRCESMILENLWTTSTYGTSGLHKKRKGTATASGHSQQQEVGESLTQTKKHKQTRNEDGKCKVGDQENPDAKMSDSPSVAATSIPFSISPELTGTPFVANLKNCVKHILALGDDPEYRQCALGHFEPSYKDLRNVVCCAAAHSVLNERKEPFPADFRVKDSHHLGLMTTALDQLVNDTANKICDKGAFQEILQSTKCIGMNARRLRKVLKNNAYAMELLDNIGIAQSGDETGALGGSGHNPVELESDDEYNDVMEIDAEDEDLEVLGLVGEEAGTSRDTNPDHQTEDDVALNPEEEETPGTQSHPHVPESSDQLAEPEIGQKRSHEAVPKEIGAPVQFLEPSDLSPRRTPVLTRQHATTSSANRDGKTDLPSRDISISPEQADARATRADDNIRIAAAPFGLTPLRDGIAFEEDSDMVRVGCDDEDEQQGEITDLGKSEKILIDTPDKCNNRKDKHVSEPHEVTKLIDESTEINPRLDKNTAAENRHEEVSVAVESNCNESMIGQRIEPGTSLTCMQGKHDAVCWRGIDSAKDDQHHSGAVDFMDKMSTSARENPPSNMNIWKVKPANPSDQAGLQVFKSEGQDGNGAVQHERSSSREMPVLSEKPTGTHEVSGSKEMNNCTRKDDDEKETNGFEPLLPSLQIVQHNPAGKEDSVANTYQDTSAKEETRNDSIAASTESGGNRDLDETKLLTGDPATSRTLVDSAPIGALPFETTDLPLSTPRLQRRTKFMKENDAFAAMISKNRMAKTAIAILAGIGAAACTHISQS